VLFKYGTLRGWTIARNGMLLALSAFYKTSRIEIRNPMLPGNLVPPALLIRPLFLMVALQLPLQVRAPSPGGARSFQHRLSRSSSVTDFLAAAEEKALGSNDSKCCCCHCGASPTQPCDVIGKRVLKVGGSLCFTVSCSLMFTLRCFSFEGFYRMVSFL